MNDDERDKLAKRIADRQSRERRDGSLADEVVLAHARRLDKKWTAMVERGDTLSVFFMVTNNRLDYTYSFETEATQEEDAGELAEFVIQAVTQFPVRHQPKWKPEDAVRADGTVVRYPHMIKILWKRGEILSNVLNKELRLQCLSFIVEDLRKKAPAKPVN